MKPTGNPFGYLGEDVSSKENAYDAFDQAQLLGWNVRVADIFALDPNTFPSSIILSGLPLVPAPRLRATIFDSPFSNTTEFIAFVGLRYTAIQNEYLMELTQAVLGQTRSGLIGAGWLENNQLVYVAMDLRKPRMVGGVDPINFYIYGVTSHDGHFTFRFSILPVRFACWNTMPVNIPSLGFHYRAKHTSNATSKINDLREYLDNIDDLLNAFMDTANLLFATSLSSQDFDSAVKKLVAIALPKPRQNPSNDSLFPSLFESEFFEEPGDLNRDIDHTLRAIKEIYESDQMSVIRGTAWGGLQSFLEWFQYRCPINARGFEENYVRASRAVFANKQYSDVVSEAFRVFQNAAKVR